MAAPVEIPHTGAAAVNSSKAAAAAVENRPAFLRHAPARPAAAGTTIARLGAGESVWMPPAADAAIAKTAARAADGAAASPAAAVAAVHGHAPPPAAAAATPPAAPASPEAALLARAADDPSLRATVMSEKAVLSLDTGGGRELELHLRVKDGVADVRIDGAGAAALDIRPQELRVALAGEGIALGRFDSGQPPPQHQHQNTADAASDEPARPAPPSPRAPAAETPPQHPTASRDRGVHITA